MKRYIAKFCIKLKRSLKNPYNLRDLFLGLFVNGLFSTFHDGITLVNTIITVFSFYVIIEVNESVRRKNGMGN
jgi:hypothetical protein